MRRTRLQAIIIIIIYTYHRPRTHVMTTCVYNYLCVKTFFSVCARGFREIVRLYNIHKSCCSFSTATPAAAAVKEQTIRARELGPTPYRSPTRRPRVVVRTYYTLTCFHTNTDNISCVPLYHVYNNM